MKEALSFTILYEFDQPVTPGVMSPDHSKIRIDLSGSNESRSLEPLITSPLNKLSGHWIASEPIPGFPTVLAFPFQKILIVKTSVPHSPLLTENTSLTLPFIPSGSSVQIQLPVRVVRVCEYGNPDNEYGFPTNTVLIEWSNSKPPFGKFPPAKLTNLGVVLLSQTENLDIQATVNSQPGRPITDAAPPTDFIVTNDDFEVTKPTNAPPVLVRSHTILEPVVAVIDTGLKTHFVNTDGTSSDQYPDRNGTLRSFEVAEVPEAIINKNGYCPITEYLRASSNAIPVADNHYKAIPTYTVFHTLTKLQILNSPFDDNLVVDKSPLIVDKTETARGRHGTIIAAIINQKGNAAVLPVKAFNQGGFGTLYDLLCSFNYVLDSQAKKSPIQVINLSFIGELHPDSYRLMYSKFNCFEQAGIWVVAAAGNAGKKLMFDDFSTTPKTPKEAWNLFPACFSKEFSNVITVTGVAVESWKLVPQETYTLQQPVLPKQVHDTVLETLGFLGAKLALVPATYRVLYNYSETFVNIGVVGPFTSVFKNAEDAHQGSSFAAAFFSAKLAEYLKSHPTPTRNDILTSLAFIGTIHAGEIQGNRLINYT